MALPPTSGHTGQTVFIDPGHGGLDPGVVGGTSDGQVMEKDATLAVANRLSDRLRADGYRVVLARTTDSSVLKLGAADSVGGAMTDDAVHRDLLARIACANAASAALLISIHFDGFSDPSVGGTETFYDAQRPFELSSKRLATDLQAALVSGLGSSDRGVWTDDQTAAPSLTAAGSNYGHLMELGPMAAGWVNTPSQMPGALVEPLFVTDPAEAAVLNDPAGQARIAKALEAGVLKYMSGA
jgi:N-acetylmuramoyl-L-alanine amidase